MLLKDERSPDNDTVSVPGVLVQAVIDLLSPPTVPGPLLSSCEGLLYVVSGKSTLNELTLVNDSRRRDDFEGEPGRDFEGEPGRDEEYCRGSEG